MQWLPLLTFPSNVTHALGRGPLPAPIFPTAYAVRNLVPHTILLQPPSEAVAAARRSATAKVQVWVPSGAARRRLGDGWCSVAMAAIGHRRKEGGGGGSGGGIMPAWFT